MDKKFELLSLIIYCIFFVLYILFKIDRLIMRGVFNNAIQYENLRV